MRIWSRRTSSSASRPIEAYLSLNLAMAVQLVTYEIFRARGVKVETAPGAAPMAAPEDMERMYVHLAQVLEEIDFRDRTQSGTNLMSRIRRFMQRAELDKNEVNIVRGILTAVQKQAASRQGAAWRARPMTPSATGRRGSMEAREDCHAARPTPYISTTQPRRPSILLSPRRWRRV